jgi:solute carrier family 25 (mitochondrial iron transporter), member 28/37
MQVVRPTPTAVYTGITHAVSRIASTEGALTMWRGMTSVVLGAGMSISISAGVKLTFFPPGPAHAVYFSTYEVVKQRLGGNIGSGHHPLATCNSPSPRIIYPTLFVCSVLILASAGACAAVTSEAFMNPFDGKYVL